MQQLVNRLGYWSAITLTVLVILIDVGMIASTLISPMTTITRIEAYAASFSSLQMLPFIPLLILAPVFVIFMLAIYQTAGVDKKTFRTTGLRLRLSLRRHTKPTLLYSTHRGTTGTLE